MAIDRATVVVPVRAKKVVDAPQLGGEVILQAPGLRDRMRLSQIDDTWAQVVELLHVAVIAPDGKPLLSREQWDDMGSSDAGLTACFDLAAAIRELMKGAAEGNA